MRDPSAPSPSTGLDFGSLREQESAIVAMNLLVLAALLVIHGLFSGELGPPARPLLFALTLRFVTQCAELHWLRNGARRASAELLMRYVRASVWINVAFALLASMLDTKEDSHYWGLLVVPVVSAAFRCKLWGTLLVAGAACSVAFAQVWFFYLRFPPVAVGEYYEAATVSTIFILVAVIVWVLAGRLRRDHDQLSANLDELQQTRDHLVAEEKLAAVGRLSASIAHEIRNPVAMISSSLAMALEDGVEAPLRAELFEIAAREAGKLEKLTTDFLSYAHTRPPDRRATQICTLLRNVASLARAYASGDDVTIDVACDDDLEADIDQFQIQQALLNLTINAIDAAPPGGVVRLGARVVPGASLGLYVENTGEAIAAEAAGRIFEPFFTTKSRGTGLGLAITRNIARAHGGDAALDLNEHGRIRFTITLPAPAPEPALDGAGGADGAYSRR